MSSGEAEMSVGQTQGLCRTLKDHMDHNIGKQIVPKSPVLGWLIEHVGVLYTLFSFDKRVKGRFDTVQEDSRSRLDRVASSVLESM